MENIISMDKVKMEFDSNKIALKDVSLSITEGEIFGLLGPSGAGKTTIIKILTGQLKATSGSAEILNVNSQKITDEIYRNIGMVLDNCGLYERLTCFDNLSIFAEIYGIGKEEIDEVLEKVELTEAKKRPVNKLSKGMTQRLVLARAIMHNPKILFLDEPTSGLDPATSLKIHNLILDLKKNGTTIFLTTHNMEEATKLCDHVALLNEGNIVEYGVPKEICRKYNSEQIINILLKSGESYSLPNNKDSAEKIYKYFNEDKVESIHSSEPDLETVFIKLTGRKFE